MIFLIFDIFIQEGIKNVTMNMMDTLEAQADEIPIEELTLAAKGIVNTLSNLIEVLSGFHRYTFVPLAFRTKHFTGGHSNETTKSIAACHSLKHRAKA